MLISKDMKLNGIHKIMQESSLKEKDKNVIFTLIDIKIENEMEKVLKKFESLETRLDITFKTLIWVVGIAFTLISVFMAIIALK
tara:strand:- start:70861 stop:71112 length:252 start_codon:yes stop_codon:yes gene_type:complete